MFRNQVLGKLDPLISLGVGFSLLVGGIVFAIWKMKKNDTAGVSTEGPLLSPQLAAPAANTFAKR